MIKETCSCGASIEVETPSGITYQREAVQEWRENHIHEPKPVPREVTDEEIKQAMGWTSVPTTFVMADKAELVLDPETFTIDEDFVYDGDGVPVWISDREQPKFFTAWAQHWTKP